MGDIFEDAGFSVPKSGTKASSGDPFTDAGFEIPTGKRAAPEPDSNIPTPERFEKGWAAQGSKNPEKPTTLEAIHEAISLPQQGLRNAGHDTLENLIASVNAIKSAPGEKTWLPSIPSSDPATWSSGKILKATGGAIGALMSPISGSVNALVVNPVTEITGNPEIGQRAGDLASLFVPIKGGAKTVNALKPETRAVNDLIEAIRPENVPEVVAKMRANPRMTAADLSDPVRLTTQGLMAGGTPEVQDLISRTVRERNATRLDATNSAYTASMGPAPDVPAMVEGLKERAREAGRKVIEPALKGAGPVNITPVIAAIDKEVQPGIAAVKSGLPLSPRQEELWRLRNQLVDPETGEQLVDAKRLHEIQSRTGDKAFNLQKSADGWTRDVGSGLRDINEKLVDAIDEASKGVGSAAGAGPYRQGRAKFKDAKDISEAFEEGFDTLKNRSGLEGALSDSPQAFKKWMENATPEEVVARRLGTRADIDRRINGVRNGALTGQTITAIPYNREKLVMLFGEQEANRLIRVMEDSTREAQTSAAITAGSKTAETKAAADRIKVHEVGGGNPFTYVAPVAAEILGQSAGFPVVGFAGSMAAKGAHMAIQKGMQMHDKARNYNFAKNALSTGPEREATINALLSHPEVVREFKKRNNALSTP